MRAKSSCDKTLRYFLLRHFTSSNYCNWVELMCFHSSLISLLYLFYGEWNLISFLLPTYASCVSCLLWLSTLPADDCVWITVYLEPLGLEITKKDFVISPEILRTDGAFSLFLAFFTLEENSASTFLAFFFIFCLDNLRLFEVVVMSRNFRFSCNSSSLFKTFSNPFDRFIGSNLSACGCPRNSRISFSKSSDCWHNCFFILCHRKHVQLTVHKIEFKSFNFYLQSWWGHKSLI